MNHLRPTRFADLVGQQKLIESLDISVKSAISRKDSLNHCLFYGPPGLGKTTLAKALANELDVKIQIANGGNVRTINKILPFLWKILSEPDEYEGSILFIDEIHRMPCKVEEFLYPVMEDFRLDLALENENGDMEIVTEEMPRFTIVGATTELGSLATPFQDRFSLKFSLDLYSPEDLVQLLFNNACTLDVPIDFDGLEVIARAGRGTPRVANGLLEWVRDYCLAKEIETLSADDVEASLEMRGIGLDGSTEQDRKYLAFLKKNKGGPIGVDSICSGINVDRETVESTIEPWLIRNQMIRKTTKGRELMP